jgi:hypothetical protein
MYLLAYLTVKKQLINQTLKKRKQDKHITRKKETK